MENPMQNECCLCIPLGLAAGAACMAILEINYSID